MPIFRDKMRLHSTASISNEPSFITKLKPTLIQVLWLEKIPLLLPFLAEYLIKILTQRYTNLYGLMNLYKSVNGHLLLNELDSFDTSCLTYLNEFMMS